MNKSLVVLKWFCLVLAATLLAVGFGVNALLGVKDLPPDLLKVLDALKAAAPIAAIPAILFLIDDIKKSITGQKESLEDATGQIKLAAANSVQKISTAKAFYEDLRAEIIKPGVTKAKLTAIRAQLTHVKTVGGPYYDAVLKRCKEGGNKFHAQRLIGVPNKEMLEFAKMNLEYSNDAAYRGNLQVQVTPWCNPVSGFNLAILMNSNDDVLVLYIVMTTDSDIVALKMIDPRDKATPFVHLFNNLWTATGHDMHRSGDGAIDIAKTLERVEKKLDSFQKA